MSQISEAIEKIKLFCPPALKASLSKSDIEVCLKDFPFRPPNEIYELYQLSNGLGEVDAFSNLFAILNLSEAIELYRSCCTESMSYHRNWLPVVSVEGFIWVAPCTEEVKQTCQLIALGDDDLIAVQWEHPPDFKNLTDVVVSSANQFEREFNLTGRCWIRGDLFYPSVPTA